MPSRARRGCVCPRCRPSCPWARGGRFRSTARKVDCLPLGDWDRVAETTEGAQLAEDFFVDFLAAWNSHDGSKLAVLMADDGTCEDLSVGETMDRDTIVDFVARAHTMSSDYAIEWVSTQRSGTSYAAEWIMSGTNDGPLTALGLPASGKPWSIRGVSVGQLDDEGAHPAISGRLEQGPDDARIPSPRLRQAKQLRRPRPGKPSCATAGPPLGSALAAG